MLTLLLMLSFVIQDSVSPDAFFEEVTASFDVRELTAVEFGNAVAYAVYLQERDGFFVVSDEHLLGTLAAFIGRLLSSGEPLTDATLAEAIDEATTEEVRWLATFVGEMRPPASRGGDERPARQGKWADVSTDLVNGFFARVGTGPVKRFPVPSIAYR